MKILVIGGSYFYGRVFVMLTAPQHEITVVNRGTYSMADMGVAQVRGDRGDPTLWRNMSEGYDIVVDFCAYKAGDIRNVLDNIPVKPSQYIHISTVDVYRRGSGVCKTEDAPCEDRSCRGRRESISPERWRWRRNCGRSVRRGKCLGQSCGPEFSMDHTIMHPGSPLIFS